MTGSRFIRRVRALRAELAGRDYLRSLTGNASWLLGERALRYGIGFAMGIVVARYLGPEQYGLLNYALAFVGTLAFLNTLGLEPFAVLQLVREPASRHELLGSLLVMRLAGGLVLIVVTVAVVAAVPPADPRAPAIIAIISIAQAIQAFDSIDCWFQAHMLARRAFLAKAVALLAMTAARVALVVLHAPVTAFAVVIVAESFLLAVTMLVGYARSGESIAALRPSRAAMRRLLALGWPMVLSAAVAAVYLRIDQVLLGYFAGLRSVGTYAVASRIIEATAIVPYVAATAAFPAIIRSRALGQPVFDERVQRLHDLVLWSALAIAAPLCAFADPIVRLLVGRAYEQSAHLLAILAWMLPLSYAGVVRQRWLIAQNALVAALAVEAAACGVNLLANLSLIPVLGATGAALSALISAAGGTLLAAAFSPRVRRSLAMYAVSATAPLRLARWLIGQS